MYTEQDFTNAVTKQKNALIVGVIILIVLIAVTAVGMITRIFALATYVPCVLACVLYTWWCVKCLPWIRYNRYLNNMREGRHRESECYFTFISDSIRVVDGVQVHDVNASVDPEGEDQRLFYWDADKEIPQIEKGQKIRITSYGNFILSCELL